MFKLQKVLISDDIDPVCPTILRENGVEVVTKTKLSPEELTKELSKANGYDGLVVRSGTTVTKEILDGAGYPLKVIGRAGTGVDNIDVTAASEHGIIVMNTPEGNSRSAAELTCALIMSLARHIPQACASLKDGKWERNAFMGTEVYGKTLAIIGLGRIGREVAQRMQAFGMTTVGFDPLVSAESAKEFGVEWLELENIWPRADYVTVHVPLIKQTANLINSQVFDKCKKGLKVINVARGGVVSEDDLLSALQDGRCGGAALDVFMEEPPKNTTLMQHPKVICTPHLGASSKEAQFRVAREIAEQFVALKKGTGLFGAVNAGKLASALTGEGSKWFPVVSKLAQIASSFVSVDTVKSISVKIPKELESAAQGFASGAVVGFWRSLSGNGLNVINAHEFAKSRGIQAEILTTGPANEVVLEVTDESGNLRTFSGSQSRSAAFLHALNGESTSIPIPLEGTFIVFASDCDSVPSREYSWFVNCGKRNIWGFKEPPTQEKVASWNLKDVVIYNGD